MQEIIDTLSHGGAELGSVAGTGLTPGKEFMNSPWPAFICLAFFLAVAVWGMYQKKQKDNRK